MSVLSDLPGVRFPPNLVGFEPSTFSILRADVAATSQRNFLGEERPGRVTFIRRDGTNYATRTKVVVVTKEQELL